MIIVIIKTTRTKNISIYLYNRTFHVSCHRYIVSIFFLFVVLVVVRSSSSSSGSCTCSIAEDYQHMAIIVLKLITRYFISVRYIISYTLVFSYFYSFYPSVSSYFVSWYTQFNTITLFL